MSRWHSQECSTLAERSGLKKFVKSVDESLKAPVAKSSPHGAMMHSCQDAVENAKEARKRFEKRVSWLHSRGTEHA